MTSKVNTEVILKENDLESLFELFAELTEIFIEKDLEYGKIKHKINEITHYIRNESSDNELKELINKEFELKQELVYLNNIRAFVEKRMMFLQIKQDSDSLKRIADNLEKKQSDDKPYIALAPSSTHDYNPRFINKSE